MSSISAVNAAPPAVGCWLSRYQRRGNFRSRSSDGYANQPAVIVTMSAQSGRIDPTRLSLTHSLDPNSVDNALSWASGANGFADNAAHFDYAGDVAQFG